MGAVMPEAGDPRRPLDSDEAEKLAHDVWEAFRASSADPLPRWSELDPERRAVETEIYQTVVSEFLRDRT